jgi:hypothetical protein
MQTPFIGRPLTCGQREEIHRPRNQCEDPSLPLSMASMRIALIAPAVLLATASAAAPVPAGIPTNPMSFFVGRTEGSGQVKVIFHAAYSTRNIGEGRIEPDGSLVLVQQVFDQGKPPHERSWHVRELGPGRFTGTMSEALGPVTIEQVGNGYRFRFAMDGHLDVEQMLVPLAGGRSASSNAEIRKFGFVVARTSGIERKV